ncbi:MULTISPECIES: glycosyltransferase [unclassified Carboxylicivirga]|uniref:glycosyltransferase n=1 Tax=Carboxylicivirga TaxID=1628153 RepID=UPI003D351639
MSISGSYRRVVVSPLNWGLGHATRLVPVIDGLLRQGHTVLLAGEEPSLHILKEVFPSLLSIPTKGFQVRLAEGQRQWPVLIKQIPSFLKFMLRDYQQVQRIVKEYDIDLIISDNRYGFRSGKVSSVIITHQTRPYPGQKLAFLRPITNFISRCLLSRFDACWVPDASPPNNLSGDLSRGFVGLSIQYVGLVSRLQVPMFAKCAVIKADVLLILSGPEPQRSLLEDLLVARFKGTGRRAVILCGQPKRSIKHEDNLIFLPHCDSAQLKSLICNSEHIICRSGYSTLMDLMVCNKRALLIPTPGQFEQEYLARRASLYFGFRWMQQDAIEDCSLSDILFTQPKVVSSHVKSVFCLPDLPACN